MKWLGEANGEKGLRIFGQAITTMNQFDNPNNTKNLKPIDRTNKDGKGAEVVDALGREPAQPESVRDGE